MLTPAVVLGQVPPAAPVTDPLAEIYEALGPTGSIVLMVVVAVFALWALYVSIPLTAHLPGALLNLLGRRGDRRTLTGTLTIAAVVIVCAAGVELFDQMEPETQYYGRTSFRLVASFAVNLAFIGFVTWVTLTIFRVVGRPLLDRGYVLFVGWHLLRSHRETLHQPRAFEGGRAPSAPMVIAGGALLIAAAWFAGDVPWARWLGWYAAAVPTVRIGVAATGLLLVTWPLRRRPPTGSIDLFDLAEARVKNLPGALMVTVTTFISMTLVGAGVWALITVLSVMAGFETDLRSKILATNPHVVIQDDEPMEGIPDFRNKIDELRAMPGVVGAIPYVQGEVIIASRDNRNVSLALRGIDVDDLAESEHHLRRTMVAGTLDSLMYPERVVSSSRWRLRQLPQGPIDDEPESSPEPSDKEDDPIEPTPIPGSEVAAPEDDIIQPTVIPGVDTGSGQIVLDEGVRPGILLGQELATSLRVGVGGEVTVVSPRDGAGFLGIQPRARTFRVAGVFNTGMYEFDLKLAYVRLSEAQRFFHMEDDVNRIELRLSDVDRSEEIAAAVAPLLDRPTLRAVDWKRLNKNLFSALQLEKIVMFIVLGFIILVASFSVVGSLVMIIIEKAPEIAVLKSMGATRGEIARMFLVLGAFVGTIGAGSGVLGGLLTCWFVQYIGVKLPRQYYIEQLPVHVDPGTILIIFFAAIGLCLAATLYPAYEAARINPVEGLRYE